MNIILKLLQYPVKFSLCNYSLFLFYDIEWLLVSENKECEGSKIEKIVNPNADIPDCARQCEGVSSMFTFSPKQKRCFCETSGTPQGSCTFEDISDYHLYKYVSLGRFHIL